MHNINTLTSGLEAVNLTWLNLQQCLQKRAVRTDSSLEIVIVIDALLLTSHRLNHSSERVGCLLLVAIIVDGLAVGGSFMLVIGGFIEQIVFSTFLQVANSVLILLKHAQAVGDADQNHLRDIDLHEDEDLVQSAEDVTDAWQVDPLIAVDAKQMLPCAWNALPVDDEVARGDCQSGEKTEDNVGDEEEFRLLLEQWDIVLEFVLADLW